MDDNKVVSLKEKRLARSDDCRDWSVEELLEDVLKDIRSGSLKPQMAVLILRDFEEGRELMAERHYRCAGGRTIELVGLLSMSLHDAFLHEEDGDTA